MSVKNLLIVEISASLACKLNSMWHSVLPRIHWSNVVRNKRYICFGATDGVRFYAVGIWSSPIAGNRMRNADEVLELRRFAIAPYAPKNLGSYMMSKMIKIIKERFPEIKRLITYQCQVHEGTLYKACNWYPVGKTKFRSWNGTRKRNPEQVVGDKVRWEYLIR